jgi:hypothetical protein
MIKLMRGSEISCAAARGGKILAIVLIFLIFFLKSLSPQQKGDCIPRSRFSNFKSSGYKR